jgi:hypothetical protein
MTKTHHPARRARNLTGAASALALVGMVTGFQFAAAAESQNELLAKTTIPTPGQSGSSTAAPTNGEPSVGQSGQSVTANGTSATQPQTSVAPVDSGLAPAAAPAPVADPAPAPAPVVDPAPAPAPVVEPAPAPPAPAPAPAPPSGTTSGS